MSAVHEARGLMGKSRRSCDSYVKVDVTSGHRESVRMKTQMVLNDKNPKYDQSISLWVLVNATTDQQGHAVTALCHRMAAEPCCPVSALSGKLCVFGCCRCVRGKLQSRLLVSVCRRLDNSRLVTGIKLLLFIHEGLKAGVCLKHAPVCVSLQEQSADWLHELRHQLSRLAFSGWFKVKSGENSFCLHQERRH